MSDPSDCFALVPFTYASPFTDGLKLSERLFDVGVGKLLRIQQHWKPDGKGGSNLGFGASVYDCSFILADYLCRNRALIGGKTVVELGCGLGLASIAVSLAGCKAAIATDGDADLLEHAMENMVANAKECVDTGTLRTLPLLWGDREHMAALGVLLREVGGEVIVIASDVAACVYESAFPALRDTLVWLCDDCGATRVILAYRRRAASEDSFFDLVSSEFTIVDVPNSELHADFASDSLIRVLNMSRSPTSDTK